MTNAMDTKAVKRGSAVLTNIHRFTVIDAEKKIASKTPKLPK